MWTRYWKCCKCLIVISETYMMKKRFVNVNWGHMHANIRWSQLVHVALLLHVGYWLFSYLFVMILSDKLTFNLLWTKIELLSHYLFLIALCLFLQASQCSWVECRTCWSSVMQVSCLDSIMVLFWWISAKCFWKLIIFLIV